ncbi:conjugal transfer protein [Streptococcus anginosus]|nr:conjugal transfer protein [Streptococcus anginosus]
MIRIRSPTKKKVNSISISDWKRKNSSRFFIEKKRRNF